MPCNIGARSIEVNMNPAFCLIFSFLVGAFTGGVVLMIAGNKFMTKQLVAEQTNSTPSLFRLRNGLQPQRKTLTND
jgi:RsiW-degrading membrane proteinase PrsW (M82 family)